MMIAEEESLKSRLINSIAMCRKELDVLCLELSLPPFEVTHTFWPCVIVGTLWGYRHLFNLVHCPRVVLQNMGCAMAGGRRAHDAAAGEGHSNQSGGDDEAEESEDAGTESPQPAGPGVLRHSVHRTL